MKTIYFGKNIKRLRELTATTQATLASTLKKMASAISNWENDVAMPTVEDLAALSNYFGVTIDSMLFTDLEHVHPNNVGIVGGKVHQKVHGSVLLKKGNAPILEENPPIYGDVGALNDTDGKYAVRRSNADLYGLLLGLQRQISELENKIDKLTQN